MDDLFPITRYMSIREVQAELPALAGTVNRRERRVVLEQEGEAIAAIMSLRDLERVLDIQARASEPLSAIEALSAAFADVPPEEVEAETLRIIQEQRAEIRAEKKLSASVIPPHLRRQHMANRRY